MITVPFQNYAELKRRLPKNSDYTNIAWTWLPRLGQHAIMSFPVNRAKEIEIAHLTPGYTFNAWRGCVKVSAACKNCYAESVSARNPRTLGEWGKDAKRVVAAESGWKNPVRWNKIAQAAGHRVACFILSMGDFFEDYQGPAANVVGTDGKTYEGGLVAARMRMLALMMECQWINWQVLTKRPENILTMLLEAESLCEKGEPLQQWLHDWIEGDPPHNIWLGTTVEQDQHAEARIGALAEVPATVRFLSMEPLLDTVNLTKLSAFKAISWVIAGGESGPGWREESGDQALYRIIRDQCKSTKTAFFMKQLAGNRPTDADIPPDLQIRQYPTI